MYFDVLSERVNDPGASFDFDHPADEYVCSYREIEGLATAHVFRLVCGLIIDVTWSPGVPVATAQRVARHAQDREQRAGENVAVRYDRNALRRSVAT